MGDESRIEIVLPIARDPSLIAEGVIAGRTMAIARAITLVESRSRERRKFLQQLRPHTGKAHVVGVLGPPGVGKSTLINRLVREMRTRGRTVGVIAVDPSSPFSGGAILGDRVRMQELASDPGVFIRSMATRGRMGGLAVATEEAVAVLDAAGKDVVVVETVGVGQDEVDVAGVAQTTVVVLAPGAGDEIQALKAGVLEVADIFVVNKADLDGADLMAMHLAGAASIDSRRPAPPVLKTVAATGTGIPEVVDALETHRAGVPGLSPRSDLKEALICRRVLAIVEADLLDRLEMRIGPGQLEGLVRLVAAGEEDLYSAAEKLVHDLLDGGVEDR